MSDPVVGAQNGTDEEKERALKIRKAIGHAINRDQVNEVMFNGEAFIATQITNPMTEGYLEDLENLKEDPEMTRSILKELGYATTPDEVTETTPRLVVDLLYITDTWATKFATTIQAQLQEAGLVVNMLGYELNSWFQRVYPTKNYQITYNAYTPNVPNPDTAFRSPYHSDSYWNPFGYSNPEVDKLIDDARYEMDKEVRVAKLEQVNRIVTQEEVIYIPVLAGNSVTLNNTYWFGIFLEPTYSYYKFYRMFWEDDGVWTPDDGFPYLDGTLNTATPAA
jgi:peptide/nickel transport system substrate-binding protein